MNRPWCCAACQSRTVRPHCELPGCPWTFRKKCMALTGIFAGKVFHRGGVERIC